jgi:hypothetical protein
MFDDFACNKKTVKRIHKIAVLAMTDLVLTQK